MPNKSNNQKFERYHTVNNALIFPADKYKASIKSGIKNLKLSSKYVIKGKSKESISKKKLRECLKKNPPKKIKGSYLYLGIMHEHFGHFLAESIVTMYASEYFYNKVLGFIAVPEKEFDKNNEVFLTVCSLLKINTKKIIFVESITEIETLIIPEIGAYPGKKIKPWYLDELARKIKISSLGSKKLPKKIFVKKSSNFVNRLLGLEYFNNLLEENDYYIFYPERHSFIQQLAFIVNAEIIIWEEGSACHIVDILPSMPKTTSLIIKRRPKASWTDQSIKNKFPDLLIYNETQEIEILNYMMSNGKQLYMAISLLNHPKSLQSLLIEKNFIGQRKFNFFIFKIKEMLDTLKFLKDMFTLPLKYFLVINFKKNIDARVWIILKKIFFFL